MYLYIKIGNINTLLHYVKFNTMRTIITIAMLLFCLNSLGQNEPFNFRLENENNKARNLIIAFSINSALFTAGSITKNEKLCSFAEKSFFALIPASIVYVSFDFKFERGRVKKACRKHHRKYLYR